MIKTIDREALYDLVWSEPKRTLAARFGVSDVALNKACQRALIPTPDRGYWAKREAGKPVSKAELPPRSPGFSHEVSFGDGGRWYRHWTREELLEEVPAPPQFDEGLESVRSRIEARLGTVNCPARSGVWHPSIQQLLNKDEARRQTAASSVISWEQPLFDSAAERRRLRILNSLFLAAGKFGGKVTIRGREAHDLSITFDRQHVAISLASVTSRGKPGASGNPNRLTFAILAGIGSDERRASWADNERERLEQQLTIITTEVVFAAEVQLREGAAHFHQWRVSRKAALEEEARTKLIEQARLANERLEQIEQARIDRLLAAAGKFRQAQEIRAYVEGLGARLDPSDTDRGALYREWSIWALAQADSIDPALKSDFAGRAGPEPSAP